MIKKKATTFILVILMVSSLTGCTPKAEFQADITSGQAPLTVTFTNLTSAFPLMKADEFRWDFGDGTTATSGTKEEPVTHQYTKAGSHTVTLTAVKQGDPPKTTTMTLTVTVKHGPLQTVKIIPETAELAIGQSREFHAEAFDSYDNPIPEAQLSWNIVEGVGTLADGGVLTAGTEAGTFDKGIVVTAKLNTDSARSSASVTVKPDPLNAVTIPPVEITAGETQPLEAVTTDQYGNRVSEMEVAWSVTDENTGSVTQAGLLTANKVAGTFPGAVEVQVTQGELVQTAVGSVTIKPGPLEQVVIGPDAADIGIGMTQQFVAVGADRYGNRISGLDFTWSLTNGGGTISADGLFTAGSTAGTFDDTVMVIGHYETTRLDNEA